MKKVIRITCSDTVVFEPSPKNYDESNRDSIEAMLKQDIRDLQRDPEDDESITFEDLDNDVDSEPVYKFELVTLDDQGKEVLAEEYDKDGNVIPKVTRTAAVIPHGGRVLTINEIGDDEAALTDYAETA